MVIPTGQQLTPEQRQQLIFQTLGGIGAGMIQNPSPQFGQMFGHGLLGGMEAQAQFGQGLLDMQEQDMLRQEKIQAWHRDAQRSQMLGIPPPPHPFAGTKFGPRKDPRPGAQAFYQPGPSSPGAPAPAPVATPVDHFVDPHQRDQVVRNTAVDAAAEKVQNPERLPTNQTVVDDGQQGQAVVTRGTNTNRIAGIIQGKITPANNAEANQAVTIAEEYGALTPSINRIKENIQTGYVYTEQGPEYRGKLSGQVLTFESVDDPGVYEQVAVENTAEINARLRDPKWRHLQEEEWKERLGEPREMSRQIADDAKNSISRLQEMERTADHLINISEIIQREGGFTSETQEYLVKNFPWMKNWLPDSVSQDAGARALSELVTRLDAGLREAGIKDEEVSNAVETITAGNLITDNPKQTVAILKSLKEEYIKPEWEINQQRRELHTDGRFKDVVRSTARVEPEKDETGLTPSQRRIRESAGWKWDEQLQTWTPKGAEDVDATGVNVGGVTAPVDERNWFKAAAQDIAIPTATAIGGGIIANPLQTLGGGTAAIAGYNLLRGGGFPGLAGRTAEAIGDANLSTQLRNQASEEWARYKEHDLRRAQYAAAGENKKAKDAARAAEKAKNAAQKLFQQAGQAAKVGPPPGVISRTGQAIGRGAQAVSGLLGSAARVASGPVGGGVLGALYPSELAGPELTQQRPGEQYYPGILGPQ